MAFRTVSKTACKSYQVYDAGERGGFGDFVEPRNKPLRGKFSFTGG